MDINNALTPQWMWSLAPEEKERVQKWITSKGIVLEDCAGLFLDLEGNFRAKIYGRMADGSYEIRDDEVVWAEDIVFRDSTPPDAVIKRVMGVESLQHRPQKGS